MFHLCVSLYSKQLLLVQTEIEGCGLYFSVFVCNCFGSFISMSWSLCVLLSLTDEHGSFGPLESLTRPDVTQDSLSSEASSVEREPRKSRARERRRDGRSKTFDWAEFRPIAQALAQQRAHEADVLQAQLGDADRNKRREERRRRYECVTGSLSFEPSPDTSRIDAESVHLNVSSVRPPSPERQQKVEDEIEQHWQQVEKTPIRDERRVPLSTAPRTRETTELEKLLESYKKGVCLHLPQVPLCWI